MCWWWCIPRKRESTQPLLKEVRFEEQKSDCREYAKTTLKYNFIIACFDNDMYNVKKYLAMLNLRVDRALSSRALQIAYINENLNLINLLMQNGANIMDLPELHQSKFIDMLMPEV